MLSLHLRKKIIIFTLTVLILTACSLPVQVEGEEIPVTITNPPSHVTTQAATAPPLSTGQDLRFEHLTVQDGLSEDRVWGITQDRRGFMWFATLQGLNRYDGYEFRVYKEQSDNPNSPGGKLFWTFYEDQQGMIWVGSLGDGGLSRFDPSAEQWTRFQHDPNDPHSLSSNNVQAIIEDRFGVLWIGTDGGGLNRFDGEDAEGRGRFTRYQHDPDNLDSLGSNSVSSIFEDRSGILWIGGFSGGLTRFDSQTETFTRYQHDPEDPRSLSHNAAFTIYEDSSDVLWVGTYGGGLNRFDRETETFTRYQTDPEDPSSLSNNTITDILEDLTGTLWIATFGGGLNRYHPESDSFTSYHHDPFDSHSLGSNTLASLFVDNSGTLWIGTAGNGISKLDPGQQGFKVVRHHPMDENSLSGNDVRAVFEDQSGDLWIGTYSGLNRFDPETGRYTHYLHDPADPTSLSDNHVWAIAGDSTGALWVGVDPYGLNRFDRDTETFTHFRTDSTDPCSLSDDIIVTLYLDRTGTLWIGSYTGGLDSFDPQLQDEQVCFTHYQHDPEDPNSLGGGAVWAIMEDSAGVLWVGTHGGGLCRLDRDTDTFACYLHDPEDGNSLSNNTVIAIHEDREGTLWIGTGDGLDRLDPQTGNFTSYTTADGLGNASIYGILDDDDGHLWISTAHGMSQFDPVARTFHNYSASDGLQGDVFGMSSYYKSSTGEMFFGGQNGLTAFYPKDVSENPNIPPVHITSLALSNEPVSIGADSALQQSIFDTERLELPHDERVISFEFAALNYISPEKNRFRYKLENFDEKWIEVGGDRRFATYTNLDPGEYIFKVLGSNNDGLWNEQGASIHLTITPPWWGTWRFQGGMLLLLVGLVAGGFVWQRDRVRKRERQLETQVAERTLKLDERVKELNCLYGVSNLAGQHDNSLEQILGGVVDLLPPAMQIPEITCARLILSGREFKTSDFQETPWQQSSPIIVWGEQVGHVEVGYLEEMREGDEGPFLVEEQLLLNVVAERLGKIVQRKQAEEALITSEEKYRNLVESVSDVVYVFDRQGVVAYVSPAIEQVLGLSPDKIFGQLFVDFILPEDLARAKKNIGKLMEGEPSGLSEYRVTHSSGEIRWVRVSSSPIINEDSVTGFQGILSDITEIKRAEITLRESEQRMNALFQSMPLPSYYWQRRGDEFSLIDCNLAADEFTNGGASKILGSSLKKLYSDRPDIIEDITRCFTEEITIHKEMGYTFKATKEDQVLAVTYAFAPPDLVIVQTEDIKDRKRLEAQHAEAAARAERDRLARRLHDDVTQTLFSASVIAESTPRIIEKNPGLGARNLEQLATMMRGALAEMRTLLIELRPAALVGKSLDDLLRMLAEANRIRIDSPIELVIESGGTLPEDVIIVFYRIAQEALRNIVKYAEAEEVQINFTQDQDGIQLVVKDNGQGFEPDKVPLGHFGMSIMQERIDQIGGKLVIDSHPNQGTQIRASWSEQNDAQGVNYE